MSAAELFWLACNHPERPGDSRTMYFPLACGRCRIKALADQRQGVKTPQLVRALAAIAHGDESTDRVEGRVGP